MAVSSWPSCLPRPPTFVCGTWLYRIPRRPLIACADPRTNADIVSRNQTSITYACYKSMEVLDGAKVITCINGTWDRSAPVCKDVGGLTEWDMTVIFSIVGGAAGLASICIFIGLIYMACYKKDRRNLYKNDIMAMDVRNGGATLDEDIYYPPGYANPGPMVNHGYSSYDRHLHPDGHIPTITDMRQAVVYDPETMSKREVSWHYRLDGSQLSIPRPVIGRGPMYPRGESSTDWDYATHPTLSYADIEHARETGQLTM